MSEPDATPETPIDDPNLLADPLTVAERLRSEPRTGSIDALVDAFANGSDLVLQVAEREDRVAFDAHAGSHAIGAPGSAAWAERIQETWRTQRAELAEAEQREAERIRTDARLSDLGRVEALAAHEKQFVEARAKQLGPVEQRIDEVLAGREAACHRLVHGEALPDERSPELRALARVAEGLRLSAFLAVTAPLEPKAFADAVSKRIRAGDPATPDLLELAAHRLSATAPEHAMALAAEARGAQRARAMATLKADPKRSAAVGELALLRRARERIGNERRFYAANPRGVMPKVTSTRG